MKKIFLSICLMCMSVLAFAQWTLLNPLPTKNNLYSVHFPDANTGYAVGDSGTILKTNDAGSTWDSLSCGITSFLHSVYFTDASTGYAVGNNGTILKTINGGLNWVTLSSGTVNHLHSIYFLNAEIGYAAGAYTILKTINGGQTWSHILEIASSSLSTIYFTDAITGYAAGSFNIPGSNGNIIKTVDGGLNWNFECNGNLINLNSTYFPDAKTGYVVGGTHFCIGDGGGECTQNQIILKTTDGGTIWTALSSGTNIPLYSVYFTNANIGYAVGWGGTILKTSDAGNTWIASPSGTSNLLRSVYFTDANTGYVVGDGGTILKTTNGRGIVSINEPLSAESLFTIYPNPATNKITVSTNRALPGETRVSIFSISGQQLMQAKFQNQKQFEMYVSTLAKGIYLVKIQTSKGIETKKLVIH
jgi:photosystem II stability/assembly factor-like uncharacterized protein